MRYASVLSVVVIACGSAYGEDARLNAGPDAGAASDGSSSASTEEVGVVDAGAGDTSVSAPKADAGPLPDEPRCSGTCSCAADQACNFVCPDGADCQMWCAAGSTCQLFCAGANCSIVCHTTATCKCIERGGHCL
jgi:hypothetical protein